MGGESVILPDGWAFSTVGECFLDVRNGTTSTQNKNGIGLPVSRIETIQNQRFDMSRVQHLADVGDDFIANFRYRPGDIAFSHINSLEHVGKTALYESVPEVFIHGMNLLRLRLGHEFIEPRFAHLFMQTKFFREEVRQRVGHAVNQVSINQKNLAEVPFIIAPLAEQRRIVEKLELLLGKVSSNQQRLSRVPGLLKRFRQSVLAAACSGRLTADWREQNDCVEPVPALIARLGSERRARHRDLCIAAKSANRSKPQEFDNVEPSVRTDLNTFDLPSDWSWVDLRFVMTVDEPFCYGVVQPGENEPSGKLLVRAGDLRNGTVNLSELRRIPAYIDAEYERSRLKGGELLVTVVGAGIGTVAIAPDSCAGFNIARAVAKVPIRDMSAEYVFYWFNTNTALSWMVGDAREVARPTLNLEQLRTILVPLPPLAEQQEIIRRVEKLFAFADQIEARLKQAQTHVDRLTQSLLAKAFRGELVATEHVVAEQGGREYEPASKLLERIRSERDGKQPTTPKMQRKATSK